MSDYSVNHITSSPHYPQSNGLAEKYVQIMKYPFYKAKEEGTDLYKSLMIYRSTPLSHKLQSPMQILQSQAARTQLPMSSVARIQQGLGAEQLTVDNKNEHLPTHNLHNRSKCHVPERYKQKMVSSQNQKPLPRTKKVQDKNR